MKKLLSLLLVLSLLLSMMPNLAVSANEAPSTADSMATASNVDADENPHQAVPSDTAKLQEIQNMHLDRGSVLSHNVQSTDTTLPEAQEESSPTKIDDHLSTPGNASIERYTVLILDTSSSSKFTSNGVPIYTADTAISYVKSAASKFFADLAYADGTNYVAVVSYKSTAQTVSRFTTDINALNNAVSSLTASESVRDLSAGLDMAASLLSSIPDGENVRKNAVLFTTGMTNAGDYSYTGYFDSNCVGGGWYRVNTGVNLYAYANHAIEAANRLKEQATLYTIGLFQTMTDMPIEGKDVVTLFMNTAEVIATSGDYYFPVDDPDDLAFSFGDIFDAITGRIITSKFKWAGNLIDDEDEVGTCYYNDRYFMADARIANTHLRTMSLAFELSSWSSNESDDEHGWTTDTTAKNAKWKNAKDLLVGIPGNEDYPGLGFEAASFAVNDYWRARPQKDSIGVVAAHKTLYDGSMLIALAIRGGGYGQEWASNFTIGKSGDHDGFSKAQKDVLDFLNKYIQEQGIHGAVKLWIVGYSRAGITANMVGGKLDSGFKLANGVTVATKDLFVYAFEPPQGAITQNIGSGDYSNIHNIVNKNDIVPMVAPSAWNFTRYSTNFYIPNSNAKINKMLEVLDDFDGMKNAEQFYKIKENVQQKKLKVDWKKIGAFGVPFISHDEYTVSTNYALQNTIDYVANDLIGSRANYYTTWQSGVREIMAMLKGETLEDLAKQGMSPGDFIQCFFNELSFERVTKIISPAFSLNPLYSKEERIKDIKRNCSEFVIDVLNNSDLWGTVRWAAKLPDALSELIVNMLTSAVEDIFVNNAESLQSLGNTIGLFSGEGLMQAHYSEITLAWMMSLDSYYNGEDMAASEQFTRIVHINCPVDIYVFDEDGNIVAYITGEEVGTFGDHELQAFINLNDEKIVMLPPEENYYIEVVGTDSGNVNVAIDEFYYDTASVNRIQNYYNVPITEGEELYAVIPAVSSDEVSHVNEFGSSAEYRLYDTELEAIEPDELLFGETAQEVFEIKTTVEGDCGIVSGEGSFVKGNFAQLEAFPVNGAKFDGWYENGKRLDTELVLRFAVTGNRNIVAKFSTASQYELSFNNEEGGTVETLPMRLSAGVQVNVVANANPGYEFAGWSTSAGTFENAAKENTWFTMPDKNATVIAHFKKNADHDSICPSKIFVDTPPVGNWAHEPIDWAVTNGITNGTSATTFSPEAPCTRSQVVTFLWRAAGCPEPHATSNPFMDVKEGEYFYKAVLWAVEKGITKGISRNEFGPDDPCTRGQVVTFQYRAHGSPAVSGTNSFEDVKSTDFYADAVIWAVQNNITNGTSATKFSPSNTCTRDQIVTFLYRDCAK